MGNSETLLATVAWGVCSSVGRVAGHGCLPVRGESSWACVAYSLGPLFLRLKMPYTGMAALLCPITSSEGLLLCQRPLSGEQGGEGGGSESCPRDYGMRAETEAARPQQGNVNQSHLLQEAFSNLACLHSVPSLTHLSACMELLNVGARRDISPHLV